MRTVIVSCFSQPLLYSFTLYSYLQTVSEFGDLELASPETGISGFTKSPTTKSYRFNVPGFIVDELSKPDPEVKDFIERPADQREIQDFDEEEQKFFFGEVEIKQPQLKQHVVKEDIKKKIQRGIKNIEQLSK